MAREYIHRLAKQANRRALEIDQEAQRDEQERKRITPLINAYWVAFGREMSEGPLEFHQETGERWPLRTTLEGETLKVRSGPLVLLKVTLQRDCATLEVIGHEDAPPRSWPFVVDGSDQVTVRTGRGDSDDLAAALLAEQLLGESFTAHFVNRQQR